MEESANDSQKPIEANRLRLAGKLFVFIFSPGISNRHPCQPAGSSCIAIIFGGDFRRQ
jgi:hypothetical protein